jgi:hypothetical protein
MVPGKHDAIYECPACGEIRRRGCPVCGSRRAGCPTLEAATPEDRWCPELERALHQRDKLRLAYDRARKLRPEPGTFRPREV